MALKFPVDLTDRYYFDLKFKTYSRPNPFTGKINLADPAAFAATGSGNIRLPVPANVAETQKLVWKQEENLDGLAGVASETMSGNFDQAGAALAQMAGTLGSAVSAGISSALGGKLVGDAAQYVLQKAGLALNPVLTQVFKHPEFREHQFSWTLAPETANESFILQQIVDTIKQQALPDIAFGGAFFSYPSIAMIQIHTGNNGNLYNFQPCVITSVTVNYAPLGVPSFFAGTNAPTLVKLDVSLLEIILNTRSNLDGSNVSGFDFSLGGIGNSAIKEAGLQIARKLL